jgi:MYXO-CTERM domain-containing protein
MYTDVSSGTTVPLTVTFVCTGVDTDGYVNGVEFTFGDGAKQLIEQNIGGVGSITTTHTYTTIGTQGASCRVRDNNNVFSSTPPICKKNITIKPKPTVNGTPVLEPEKGAVLTTPLLLATISTSPEATPSPTIIPTPYVPPEPSTPDTTWIWWISGGAVALVAALLLFRRRRPPMPPAQSIPPMNPPTDASMPQNIEM